MVVLLPGTNLSRVYTKRGFEYRKFRRKKETYVTFWINDYSRSAALTLWLESVKVRIIFELSRSDKNLRKIILEA